MHNPQDCYTCLIPKPASIFESEGTFILSRTHIIFIHIRHGEITSIAQLLTLYLAEATGEYHQDWS